MSDFNKDTKIDVDKCMSDADKYVNDTYKIYSSDEYLKTLKESGYTQEEIKDFLDEVKQTSRECFNNVNSQQTKILSYVLDDKIHSKDELDNIQPKDVPVNSDKLKSNSELLNPLENKSFLNKYFFSSLSQSDYYKNIPISINN